MKNYLFLIFLFVYGIGFGQIPNGDFEEWELIDTSWSPKFWNAPNVPDYRNEDKMITRVKDVIGSGYSMAITNSYHFEGPFVGVAYTKFYLPKYYDTLSFDIQIDTMETSATIQLDHDGIFFRLGTIDFTEKTNGKISVKLPLKQVFLDTVTLSVFVNSEPTFNRTKISEIIVDNFQLSEGIAPLTQKDSVTICEEEVFNFKDTTLTEAGNHALFYANATGADSLYLFNLTILEHTQTTIDTTLAPNSFFENTLIQNDTTIYKNLTAANGCDSLMTIHIMVQTTYVENAYLSQTIQLFPNPAQDKVQIKINDSGSAYLLQVYNLMGQVVYEQSRVNFDEFLNVSNWKSGVYVFRFEGDDGVVRSMKMVKAE